LPDLKLADKCRKIAYNVNAFKKVGDEKVRKLLEFISTGKSETSLTNKINQELIRVQGNEEWRAEYMTLEMLKKDTYDSGFTAGRNEGISIGLSQAKIETAKNALTMNLSIEQVAILTGLSPEEIEKL
jgi:predicted transposase/invertase (TIGR01784 family)